MLAKLDWALAKIEAMPLSFRDWCFGIFAVILVRLFLENTSDNVYTGYVGYDFQALVHLTLIFLTFNIILSPVVSFFAKKNIREVARVLLVFFPVIWLGPLLDNLFGLLFGTGTRMAYLFQDGPGLVRNFFSYFGAQELPGITLGMKVWFGLVFLFVFFYVARGAKNIWRGVLAMIAVYTIAFLMLSLPSLLALPSDAPNPSEFFERSIDSSSLMEKNFVHQGVAYSSLIRRFEVYFDGAISHAIYLLLVIFSVIAAWKLDKKKLLVILKNSRLTLSGGHWFLMIIFGMVLAVRDGNSFSVTGWLDVTFLVILFLSYYFSWMFAAGINDLGDVEGDRLTNTKRPLVTGALSREDMKDFNISFFILSLFGGYLAGQYIFFLILSLNALVYLYSCPPFRLKRLPIINPFLISLSMVNALLAGYFTLSLDRRMDAFPKEIIFLIILAYVLLGNIKDLKDLEGDIAMKSYTLPVLFGLERAKKIVGIMSVLGLLLFPLFLNGSLLLWLISLLASMGSYILINRKVFAIQPVFFLCGAYFLLVFAFLLV